MTVITICQRKGGVGKSTACLNLSCVLAEAGYRVLIIDLDDQQNTTKSISKLVETDKTIEDLLLKDDLVLNEVCVKTEWNNAAACSLEQAGQVYILPASGNLSGVVKHLDSELGGHLILKEKLTSEMFDFVLIDTSPSLNILVINALCASKYMLIPLSSKYFSMQGLSQTLSSFKKVTDRLNPELKLLGIAVVNHDKRNVLANEVLEQIKDKFKDEMFNTVIGINIKIEEAQVKKQSILTYAPLDRGCGQYRELGGEIITRINAGKKL